LLPKATINLGAAGSPGRKTKDKKGGNLEYKQKVKTRVSFSWVATQRQRLTFASAMVKKGWFLWGGDPKNN